MTLHTQLCASREQQAQTWMAGQFHAPIVIGARSYSWRLSDFEAFLKAKSA
jgi:hypothetical protein